MHPKITSKAHKIITAGFRRYQKIDQKIRTETTQTQRLIREKRKNNLSTLATFEMVTFTFDPPAKHATLNENSFAP